LKRIISSSTNQDDVILDPFNGSGTTGIAAKLIGKRNYIGVEMNKDYVDITVQRYKALKN